jgi:PilZ domain
MSGKSLEWQARCASTGMALAHSHAFGTDHYRVPRSSPRTFMHAPAEVKCSAVAGIHVAMIRDVSATGIFFYSDFKPPVGSRVILTLDIRSSSGNTRVRCDGKVVRVEQVRSGAAPGIALLLDSQQLAFIPSRPLQQQSKIA